MTNPQADRGSEEVAALAEPQGDPFLVARRWLWASWPAYHDGRLVDGRDAIERLRAAVDTVGERAMEVMADYAIAFGDVWQGEPEPRVRGYRSDSNAR